MENDEIFREVENLIRIEYGVPDGVISRVTLIEDDLGITGYDAIELIEKLYLKFNFDVSSFNPDKFFFPEPSMGNNIPEKVEPLTIGDLCNAIQKGKLD